jgi:YesN/AraC family two-component response regulator
MTDAETEKPWCFLIVEDDQATRTTISSVVSRKFPEVAVQSAENGRQGLELCRQLEPVLVITDINMPVMDGLQMIEEIKAARPQTAFIVMTAYSDRYHLENCSHLGISDFLVKPVELRELFAASQRCLDQLRQERP